MDKEPLQLHEKMERLTGADVRLMYGFGVPTTLMVVAIIAFAITGEAWLLPAIVTLLLVCAIIVTFGIFQMLGEDNDDDDEPTP